MQRAKNLDLPENIPGSKFFSAVKDMLSRTSRHNVFGNSENPEPWIYPRISRFFACFIPGYYQEPGSTQTFMSLTALKNL